MSWFVAIRTQLAGRKPVGRTLYATKAEAQAEVDRLHRTQVNDGFVVMDADHEPGRSILRDRREGHG